jgi:hypothetical protein
MNPEEAKLILQCRRPAGQDDALPAMAEAWKVLEHLPEDRAALEADAALDALIGSKLRGFAPPEALRRNILTGARVTPRLPWWRRRTMLFSAAALVAAGVAGVILKSGLQPTGNEIAQTVPAASLSDFREATTGKVSRDKIALTKVSPKPEELQEYLAVHSKGKRIALPPGLSPLSTHGCEVFEWKGREVTLMCFETADAGIAHLFTISADDLPADLAEPLVASANGWQTLTWKQDGKIMQLIAQTTPEKLRQLVLPG